MRASTLSIVAFAGAAAPAFAADHGIYAGAAVGHSNIQVEGDPTVTDLNFDGSDTGYKLILGFRPLDWLGIEANYVDFGKPEADVAGIPFKAKGQGVSAFAVGFITLGSFDIYGKAGALSWNAKLSSESLGKLVEDDGTHFGYGLGAQFRLGSLAIRAEYEAYDTSRIDTLNMVSLGVTWTFL